MKHITDFREYLNAVRDEHYTVFLSIKDDGTAGLTDECLEELRALGLNEDFTALRGCSYLAVIDASNVQAERSNSVLEVSDSGSIRDHRTLYSIKSGGHNANPISSVTIDGKEYSKNLRGMNFVIYDNLIMKVIDQVVFDTYRPDMPATR